MSVYRGCTNAYTIGFIFWLTALNPNKFWNLLDIDSDLQIRKCQSNKIQLQYNSSQQI